MANSMQDLLDDGEGYDSDLFEERDKARDFKCPICTCISRDPVETEPCGHLYCKSCLEEYLQCSLKDFNDKESNNNPQNPQCAACRAKIDSTTHSKWVRRQVNNLRIKCPNYRAGCEWKSDLSRLRDHIKNDCQYVLVSCQYCTEFMSENEKNNENNESNENENENSNENCIKNEFFRKDSELHYSQCLYFPTKCDLCELGMKRKDLSNHLENECEMKEIDCPQQCNLKKKIIYKHLNDHILNECENSMIECPYSQYGCQLKIQRKKQRLHLINYQMLHLELKVLYLERLAQSPELINLSNATGVHPEIGGLYYREPKPHNGYAYYTHDMNKSFIIRFDRKLAAWVLDINKFDGDIIATRRGCYLSPTSNAQDTKESQMMYETLFLDLENNIGTNLNENDNGSMRSMNESGSDMEIDEKQNILYPTPIANIVEKNEAKNKENNDKNEKNGLIGSNDSKMTDSIELKDNENKNNDINMNSFVVYSGSVQISSDNNRNGFANYLNQNKHSNNVNNEKNNKSNTNIIYNDGCWHLTSINAQKNEKTRILMEAYTQKEWDLEWELTSMRASLGRNKTRGVGNSGKIVYNRENDLAKQRSVVSCKCGKELEETTVELAYGTSDGVLCNACDRMLQNAIYHCPGGSNMQHLNGFDLCLECGSARLQTQRLKPVPCKCRKTMVAMFARNAYPWCNSVVCNECEKQMGDETVMWHCQQKHCKQHKRGYDLCLECGSKVAPVTKGIFNLW